MSDELLIKYDGGDADGHSIDMRQLGESLQGIDRLISDILIIGSQKRLPKKGERAPLVIKAYEPKPGTVSIPLSIQEAAALLQLGWQIFGSNGAEIVGNWLRGVLLFNLGKTSEAEQAMQHIAELAQRHEETIRKIEDHRHEEMMHMIGLLKQQLPKTAPAMLQAAAPVGRSVHRLWLFSGKSTQPRLEVDREDAEALRARADLEWTSAKEWILATDGFVFHNRRLSVHHPHGVGFFSAEIVDPVAEEESNPYATAVQKKARIRVTAKAAYRGDSLERLVISDFGGEIEDAA